jgi:bifunctional UDP-N-acetylglucosamine pyrophosphorylase/glucosamine-1-phosphate N-acetyltransferase
LTSAAEPVRPGAVVVLAAGEGTRMRSTTPKVLHELCGRTLLGHVLAAARALEPEHLVVVVGHAREQVEAHVAEIAPEAVTAHQTELLGTGNAVRRALDVVPDVAGTVVVLNGDAPLLTSGTLRTLVDMHAGAGNAATVLSATVPDPHGLGRIVRDVDGHLAAIVEQRDATGEQLAIREINSGMFAFDGVLLRTALKRLTTDNAQGQEYLTDVVALLRGDGHPVDALAAPDHRETLGCNDRVELSRLRALLRDRLVEGWMRAGTTVIDPATVWLDVDVTLGRDAVIHPNVQLHGSTTIGEGARIGPDSTLTNTTVSAGATVIRAHCEGAEIGPGATVGPFAFLRPGTVLGPKAKIGAYVEVKNSDIGEGSKVPHLSYVGDATIGDHSNIGAATVFVNYDGVHKHRSTIGSHARTGSDNMFIAPVTVGDGAYTAAGSVITEDVPPGAMGVARSRQRNIEGWVERKRPGTAAADAAARARAAAPDEPEDTPSAGPND